MLVKIYSEKGNIFVCPTDSICVAVCVLVNHFLKESYIYIYIYIKDIPFRKLQSYGRPAKRSAVFRVCRKTASRTLALYYSKITRFPFNTNFYSKGLPIPLLNLLAPVLNRKVSHCVGQSLRSGSSLECWRLRFELRNMWGVRDVSHCNRAQLT